MTIREKVRLWMSAIALAFGAVLLLWEAVR